MKYILALALILASLPASANRVLQTPFAETLKQGDFKLLSLSLKESESTDKWRYMQRLDVGVTDDTEFGTLTVDPEYAPSRTTFNLQQRIAKESASRPTISVGVWDAGHIEKFSGDKTGGSFFVTASKTVPTGKLPVKVNIGAGTNRLEGIFAGAIVPVSKKMGVLVEYSPENNRLPGTDGLNAAVYYRPRPDLQLRASMVGGDPMFDIAISKSLGR